MTFISSGLLTVIQKCPYAVKRLLIRGKSVKIYQWILCKWNRSGLSLMKQTSQQTSSVILVKRYSKFHAWFLKYPNVFETFWLFFFFVMTWLTPAFDDQIWLTSVAFPPGGWYLFICLVSLSSSAAHYFFSHLLGEFLEIVIF